MLKPFVIHLQLQNKGEVITDRRIRLDEADAHRLYDTLENTLLQTDTEPAQHQHAETALQDALGHLLQWAVGNRGIKDSNPYGIPEVRVALKALAQSKGWSEEQIKRGYYDAADSYWNPFYVGRNDGSIEPSRFPTLKAAESEIDRISATDYKGVANGDYYIDGPEELIQESGRRGYALPKKTSR